MDRVELFPDVPVVLPKFQHFAENGNDFDAVFFGSSRVYYGLSPKVFDATMATRGHSVRSFNFGVGAMIPPESFCVLKRLVKNKSPRTKWVFVEWVGVSTQIKQRGTRRDFYWRGPEETGLISEKILASLPKARTPAKQLARMRAYLAEMLPHAGLSLRYDTSLGRGADYLQKRIGITAEEESVDPLGPLGDGFIPNRPYTMPERERAAYLSTIAEMKADFSKWQVPDPVSERAFFQILDEVRRSGATPILFIPPTVRVTPSLPLNGNAKVFAFNSPIDFPNLYEVDRREDREHLSALGAEEFSRVFAERFSDYLTSLQGSAN